MVAVRPGPAAEAVLAAARSAARSLTLLDLKPLDRSAADLLIGPDRPAEDRARIFESSGGNPLLLEELAKGDAGAVPSGIVAAVSAELADLGDDALALVRAGSVLGDPFDSDLAAVTAELTPPTGRAAVDDLLARGLVRPSGAKQLTFRHPVIRTAVYESQPVVVRQRAHARAAAALDSLGAPLPSRARHLAHVAEPGDVESAAALREAARLVRGHAPSIAADWMLAAKRAAPPAELSSFSDLAEVLVQSGRLDEALAVAEEGLLFGEGSAGDRVRLVLAAASVERLLGRHEAARRRLVRAVDEPSVTESLAAEVAAALALSAYERGDYDELASWAEAARRGDGLVGAAASSMVALGHRFAGRIDEAGVGVGRCCGRRTGRDRRRAGRARRADDRDRVVARRRRAPRRRAAREQARVRRRAAGGQRCCRGAAAARRGAHPRAAGAHRGGGRGRPTAPRWRRG